MMIEDLCNMDLPFYGSSITEELFPQLDFDLNGTVIDIAGKVSHQKEDRDDHLYGDNCVTSALDNNGDIDEFANIESDILTAELDDLSIYLLDKKDGDLFSNEYSIAMEDMQTYALSDVFAETSHAFSHEDGVNMDFSLPLPSPTGNSTTVCGDLEMKHNDLPYVNLQPEFTESESSQDNFISQASNVNIDLTASGLFDVLISANDIQTLNTPTAAVLASSSQTLTSSDKTVDLNQFISQQPLVATFTQSFTELETGKESDTESNFTYESQSTDIVSIDAYSTSNEVKPRKGGRKKLPANIKKERKKCQNRSAASRYRVKKKEEKVGITSELEELEAYNKQLKDSVKNLEYEIKYMKDLMKEIPHIAANAARLGITL